MESKRDFYKVLLVSQSGKGKTYSFRNMNSETTGFINVENKPLPFKGKFKYHGKPTATLGVFAALKAYAENPEINCIVLDSLSACMDFFLAEAKATKKGFDIWNHYNELVAKFLDAVKKVEKEVFLTAHYEWVQDEAGAKERRTKTQGKAWEGTIEKEFSLVLYADRKLSQDGKVEAWFDMALENSSSKCPPDIFGENVFKIPNDSNEVLNAILKFVE
jgi:hypothetical protein